LTVIANLPETVKQTYRRCTGFEMDDWDCLSIETASIKNLARRELLRRLDSKLNHGP